MSSSAQTGDSARLGFRYHNAGSMESDVSILERRLCQIVGTDYGICVNSCSSGILLSLMSAGCSGPVLCPAFTFIAVPSAIALAGCTPVLVECDSNFVIDIDDLIKKAETTEASSLVLSYMRGYVPELDKLMSVCAEREIVVIEDAAHALGVTYRSQHVGSFGSAGVLSFQSYKLVDGGEGGFVCTSDRELAARVAIMSGCYEQNWVDHGTIPGEVIRPLVNTIPVFNMRMTNHAAAMILDQLDRLEESKLYFRRIYRCFLQQLIGATGLHFPVRPPEVTSVPDSVQFTVAGANQVGLESFSERLRSIIPSATVLGLDALNARAHWNWHFVNNGSCPRTRAIVERVVDFRLPRGLDSDTASLLATRIRACWDDSRRP